MKLLHMTSGSLIIEYKLLCCGVFVLVSFL